jgi:Ni,Fe-hydrogenase III large subunit
VSTYTIPVGPLHVALEEPMYFKVDVEGETVRSVEITAGHAHRGVEYLATKRSIYQDVTLTERICSLCSNSHPETYCMAIESIAGIEIPERAQYLRVMASEIKRIASHLFNIAIQAHLVGFDSLFMHVMETREIMQDVKETLFGNRMEIGANTIGGVRFDLDTEGLAYLESQLKRLEPTLDEIIALYRTDRSFAARTRGIGVLTTAEAVDCGVVGPVARASGIAYDTRIKAPYNAYDRLDVPVQTGADGDVWSRVMVRLNEAKTSIDVLRQCAAGLPEGETGPRERQLIPPGQAIAKCEAPRGELIYYVKTDGSPNPERVKWRVPSFMNWGALTLMLANAKVADIALIVNSVDPCISCTER